MADITITVDSTQVVRSRSELDRLGLTVVKQAQTVQRLERQYKILDAAFNRGKLSAEQYAKGVQQIDTAIEMVSSGNMQLAQSMNRVETAAEAAGAAVQRAHKPTNQFGMYAQQVGYQVGDFFVQVQSGTNALTAFGQQATQLAGLLPGLAGAIVGIGISLGTALGMAALRAQGLTINFKQVGQDLLSVLEPIQPIVTAIGSAVSVVGNLTASVFGFVFENLDRLAIYAGVAAAYMVGPWVMSFFAATTAVGALNTALLVLRATMIRLGITAFIVAAGELIYQFTRLANGAGGFAAALGLLADVGKEAFGRIGDGIAVIPAAFDAAAARMNYYFSRALSSMAGKFVEFAQIIVDGFNSMFPGANLSGPDAFAITRPLAKAVVELDDIATEAENTLSQKWESLTAPLASIEALREAMRKADEGGKAIDYTKWFTGDSADGKGESPIEKLLTDLESVREFLQTDAEKEIEAYVERQNVLQGALQERLITQQEYYQMSEELARNHQETLNQLDAYRYGTGLAMAQTFFGDMANALQSGNSKMAKAAKAFAAVEALINSYRAYAQVIADPSLPWFAKIPAALSVLGAGLGIVNAIKGTSTSSVSASGGGVGGGGGGVTTRPQSPGTSTVAPTQQTPMTPQTVRIDAIDPESLYSGQTLINLFDAFYNENDKRGKVFIVAR